MSLLTLEALLGRLTDAELVELASLVARERGSRDFKRFQTTLSERTAGRVWFAPAEGPLDPSLPTLAQLGTWMKKCPGCQRDTPRAGWSHVGWSNLNGVCEECITAGPQTTSDTPVMTC